MWALVETRTSDGHVYSVRTFQSRQDALEHTKTYVPNPHRKALDTYGECVLHDVRVSVIMLDV